MTEVVTKSLPENAYTPLKPGETCEPLVLAGEVLPELTWRSVGWGLFLCVIFTVASAYSGLKVGQVMESAIPISILVIGLARMYRTAVFVAGERNHHRNWRSGGIGGGRGNLHVAGAVYLEAGPAPNPDDFHLRGRRMPGGTVPDSVAAVFRAGAARATSLP